MSYNFKVEPDKKAFATYQHDLTFNGAAMLRRAGFHPYLFNNMTVAELQEPVFAAHKVLTDNKQYFLDFDDRDDQHEIYVLVLAFLKTLDAYLARAPEDYIMRTN